VNGLGALCTFAPSWKWAPRKLSFEFGRHGLHPVRCVLSCLTSTL
jgi:hypothetical protein